MARQFIQAFRCPFRFRSKDGDTKSRCCEGDNPVLTIHGTRDRNAAYGAGREWAQLLPNARLLTVKDAAHFPWVDDPKLVFDSINVFLSGRFPKQAEKVQPTE